MLHPDLFAVLLAQTVPPGEVLDAIARPFWTGSVRPDASGSVRFLGRPFSGPDPCHELLPPHVGIDRQVLETGPVATWQTPDEIVIIRDRWVDLEQHGGTRITRKQLQDIHHNHWPEAIRFFHETFAAIRGKPGPFFLVRHLLDTHGILSEARKPLAERMKERIERQLDTLQHRLTRNLSRQHRMLPIRRIQEVDAYCIRHVTRQPGISILEKAGSRQELMGLERVVSHDSWENRFLKALLTTLRDECEIYRTNPEIDPGSESSRNVAHFSRFLDTVLGSEELSGVRNMAMSRIALNNVLQKRPDYRHMVTSFRQYRREKRLIRDMWPLRVEWLGDYLFWHLCDVIMRLEGGRPDPLPPPCEHDRKHGTLLGRTTFSTRVAIGSTAWVLSIERLPGFDLADVALHIERHDLEGPLDQMPRRESIPFWVFWGDPGEPTLERGRRLLEDRGRIGVAVIMDSSPDASHGSRSPLTVIPYRFSPHEVGAEDFQEQLFAIVATCLGEATFAG
ncbi:MAG: DUF2357 domain-containing protein [bacterium]|nr:DUF2357 domain-containing protein [bacterium]